MASIETLVEDIEKVLAQPHIVNQLVLEKFGAVAQKTIERQLLSEERTQLSMSMLGTRCDRQLQYKVGEHLRTEGEALSASTRLKFMYGDLIEALILLLAREAGHKVEGEQDELNIDGILGHRDAIIDGVLVDVKSASTFSYSKFKSGLSSESDNFGYINQLRSYLFASRNNDRVLDKRGAAFVVVDKQFGHICLDYHILELEGIEQLVKAKKYLLASRHLAPRSFEDEPDGKSGNRKLGTVCSYCAFKRTCWPTIQTYLYSTGPRYLTKVVREPEVERIG